MILSLTLPKVGAQMAQGTIHRLVAKPGDELRPGTPVLEVRVDLESEKAQDCPPLFFFRIISTERAVFRSFSVEVGALVDVGSVIGVVTSQATESLDGPAIRPLRTTSAAIQIDPLSRR